MKPLLPPLPVTRAPLLVYEFQGWRWWCKKCRDISETGYSCPGTARFASRERYDTKHNGDKIMTADDITTAVSPEEDPKYLIKVSSTDPDHQVTAVTISDPETDDPTTPQPECITCHGRGAPDVQEAVERLRGFLVGDTASSPVATDMLTVLNALEKHHQ